jgi:hypothetical protein
LSKEINAIVEEWQKKDQEVKKMNQKMERIKQKIRPLVAKEIKKNNIKLEEFDVVGSTKLRDDKVEIQIFNEIEEVKKQLRERNKERDEQKIKDESDIKQDGKQVRKTKTK